MVKPFTWEEAYKRTWEDTRATKSIEKDGNRVTRDHEPLRRGLIRHFHVIIDQSEKIDDDGYIPNFRYNIIKAVDGFIQNFYQENPISTLSFLSVRNAKAQEYAIADNKFDIKSFLGKLGAGYFSLQDALDESIAHIEHSNYLREILIITPSITIRHSNDLNGVFEKLKGLGIKSHCINLCGELQVLKSLAKITNGVHCVPVDYSHFRLFLDSFCIPKRISSGQRVNLLKFGFPEVIYEQSFCACHLELTECGYLCVMCSTKVCALPIRCPICDTQLVSLINLSKAAYHQYPLQKFAENKTSVCKVCNGRSFSECNKCLSAFCIDCDDFIHETVGFCPFC